jgi:hypothetical protein
MTILSCFGSVDDIQSALHKERTWLVSCEGRSRAPQSWKDRKDTLVKACVTILGQSPAAASYSYWMARKPDRARMIRDARAFLTRAGNRAVAALVDLALSDLEACRSFHQVVFCGPLEIKARRARSVTDARRAQLAAAREAKQAQSRQCRETYESRKAAHLNFRRSEATQAIA